MDDGSWWKQNKTKDKQWRIYVRKKVVREDRENKHNTEQVTYQRPDLLTANQENTKLEEEERSYPGDKVRGFGKKEKIHKSEFTMEVGGWVQVSLGIVCCFGKSSHNSSKPVGETGASCYNFHSNSIFHTKICKLKIFWT